MKFAKRFLAAPLILGLSGCSPENPEYIFDGDIDGRNVKYYGIGIGGFGSNYLEVTNPDGTKIVYMDQGASPGFYVARITVTDPEGGKKRI